MGRRREKGNRYGAEQKNLGTGGEDSEPAITIKADVAGGQKGRGVGLSTSPR
jgi:hypothetical protein